ncbi:MBOAT family O-acyltransferase [Ruminococcus sp. NK3A76]|uniref:MBOAT family O-acyltransferase n=1 Tax=Ruminococcus sp. NK3A76 TaxID=877411 RepID=UPI00048ADFE7|nr:MBOAT family O-acyltransferase [Ruminococcus sp. NK3A76]
MTFSSVIFLFIFLPVTFGLYCICAKDSIRNILLMLASLVFYAFGEPVAVFIMIISVIINYFLGRAASKDKHDKAAVFLAVLLNIGLLIAFKYTGFFAQLINDTTGIGIPVPKIRLPIGISFFTFQGLSYVIDVYRDKKSVQKSLMSVLLYISFFPQLIAGPIVKYHDIEAQLHKRELTADRVSRGVNRFITGLAKKVLIANQMGLVADTVFGLDPDKLGSGAAWIGAVCYSLQIFFDFSGYSDMAIGLGCMFGFDFKDNFNYPFSAGSMQDFWRRWHISLSTWFKEYVYIPLGGNRKGKVRTDVNKIIVFFLTGFWHGANFTFIVWGLAHGFFLLLENHGLIPTKNKKLAPLLHIYTMLVVIVTFVIFRADTLTQGVKVIADMFTFSAGDAGVDATVYSMLNGLVLTAFIFGVIICIPTVPFIKAKLEKTKAYPIAQYTAYTGTLVIFALCVLSLVSSTYNPFIYFRF